MLPRVTCAASYEARDKREQHSGVPRRTTASMRARDVTIATELHVHGVFVGPGLTC
jgi:hypothetical protein